MNLKHYVKLAVYKAFAELKAEAARAYLGFFWWFLEPVIYMAAFYIVFEIGLRHGGEDFVAFLLCGLVVYKWFGSTVQGGTTALSRNAGLIQQVYIPKLVLPLVLLVSNTMKFLTIFCIFLIFLVLLSYDYFTISWLALPGMILVQVILIAGISGIVSAVTPFMPDLKTVLTNILMLHFLISGIFFDIGEMPEHVQRWLMLNPVAVLIKNYRLVLLHGQWPDWTGLSIVMCVSLLSLSLAIWLLIKFDRVYPKLIVK